MRNQMKNVSEQDGELPDWYVWSAIYDLDSESTSPNRLQANTVAVFALVVFGLSS
jgi:hypothetical protein